MRLLRHLLCVGFVFGIGIFHSNTLVAKKIYVDPINGQHSNNGTYNYPFKNIQYLFDNGYVKRYLPAGYPYKEGDVLVIKNPSATIQPGDTIVCLSGNHGRLSISQYYFPEYLTIVGGDRQLPIFESIEIGASSKIRVQKLTVTPESYSQPGNYKNLVLIEKKLGIGAAYDIEILDCNLYSREKAYHWQKYQWNTKSKNGIIFKDVDRGRIVNNYMKNVDFGIEVHGDNIYIYGNTIENFAGDGLRGLGNDLIFEQNTIKNVYDVNANHDDGFQTFNFLATDTFSRVQIIGNTFVECDDDSLPLNLRGRMQGIVAFDGNIKDWTVANNLVIVDHVHGITLTGAYNCHVYNNTVVDSDPTDNFFPLIQIDSKKNGVWSSGNSVKNNIAVDYFFKDKKLVDEHNIKVHPVKYSYYFLRSDLNNFHLNEGTSAVDGGVKTSINKDRNGTFRPRLCSFDVGCYEYSGLLTKAKCNEEILVYPNPTNDSFQIRYYFPLKYVLIYDIYGKLVETYTGDYNEVPISVEDYTPGTYSVRLIDAHDKVQNASLVVVN